MKYAEKAIEGNIMRDLNKTRNRSKEYVGHPERHLAVFSQHGYIKDEAVQKLLQH